MFNERWQGWKKKTKWAPYTVRNIANVSEKRLVKWMDDVDSYGNKVIDKEREEDFIRKTLAELKKVTIVEGNPKKHTINKVIVDITVLQKAG